MVREESGPRPWRQRLKRSVRQPLFANHVTARDEMLQVVERSEIAFQGTVWFSHEFVVFRLAADLAPVLRPDECPSTGQKNSCADDAGVHEYGKHSAHHGR